MDKQLTLCSLFDGSGAFCLGAILSGINPISCSEIEPFPIRVTTKRLPGVKHLGDISKIHGDEIEPVDIITFGSPCQNLSIAGNRNGLNGKQSVLFYQATRIVKEMREKTDGKYPRFIVWENVYGAFSSNGGEDFRAVLQEICSIKGEFSIPRPEKWSNAGEIVGDGFSLAWRVLDAQYWGVPQRRKRIYLVADFIGECAGKILFDSESLSGYSSKITYSWKDTAAVIEESTGDAAKLTAFENHSQDTRYKELKGISPTILSTYGMGGNNQPLIVKNMKSYDVRLTSDGTKNRRSNVYETQTSRTIDTGGNAPDSNQGGVAIVGQPVYSSSKASFHTSISKDVAATLVSTDYIDPPIVYEAEEPKTDGVIAIEGNGTRPSHNGDGYSESEVMYTLNTTEKHAVAQPNYVVRRLTPVECARLQGFPDWWCDDLGTRLPNDSQLDWWMDVFETHRKAVGKSAKPKTRKQVFKWLQNPYSDSAAYKMWGNGCALPNVVFVLSGIAYFGSNKEHI